MRLMRCARCGKEEAKTGNYQKYCAACQQIVHQEQTNASARRNRQKSEKYREYERERYRRNPEAKKKAALNYYRKVRANEELYQKLKERTRKAMGKHRDKVYYGGNRQAVFDRDGNKCQVCETTEQLAIHHLDGNGWTTPKDKRNNSLDNLITLCHSCHARLHRELENLI